MILAEEPEKHEEAAPQQHLPAIGMGPAGDKRLLKAGGKRVMQRMGRGHQRHRLVFPLLQQTAERLFLQQRQVKGQTVREKGAADFHLDGMQRVGVDQHQIPGRHRVRNVADGNAHLASSSNSL